MAPIFNLITTYYELPISVECVLLFVEQRKLEDFCNICGISYHKYRSNFPLSMWIELLNKDNLRLRGSSAIYHMWYNRYITLMANDDDILN